MKEIIKNLWISDYKDVYGRVKKHIKLAKNFNMIITVSKEHEFITKDYRIIAKVNNLNLKTMIFPLEDGKWKRWEANERIFLLAIDYVYKKYKEGNKILVHCFYGQSRSCAVIMGVMMRLFNLNFNAIEEYIRLNYKHGSPAPFFVKILKEMDFYWRK